MRGPAAALLLLAAATAASAADGTPFAPHRPPEPMPEPPTALRLQAIETFRHGLYREAAKLYELEASTRPHDLEALRDSVWAFWYSGQYARTASQGLRLIAKLPEDLEALNLTARSFLISKQRTAALRIYLRSLQVDPKQPAPRRAVARIYEWLRSYEVAASYADDVLVDYPDDAGMHALIGRARFHQGRYAQSARAWTEAATLEPTNLHYRIALAHALYFAGKKEQALRIARQIMKEDRRFWPAPDFLAAVAVLESRPDDAFAVHEASLSPVEAGDGGRLMRLARLYERFGREEKFLAAVDRALALDPEDPEALMAKGAALLKRGRPQEAGELYRRALDWKPAEEDGLAGLARSLALSSRAIESLETLARARALSPSDPDLLLMESNQLYRLGERRRARSLLLDWLEYDSDTPALVLRYHGLARSEDDPVLANPTHMTVEAFAAQLTPLKKSGFQAVTAAQVSAWEHADGDLPPRSVLILFEDAKLDTLLRADPVLAGLGYKAAVSVDRKAVDAESPVHPRWSDLKRLEKTGRWEPLVTPRPRKPQADPNRPEAVDLDWDPAVVVEADSRSDWDGGKVSGLVREKDPRLRVRRTLLARAAWERRPKEAMHWLRENEKAGAPKDVQLADEGRIRWAVGDRALGLQLARKALRLDREPEHELLVESFEKRLRPGVTATTQNFRDNRDRSHVNFDQSIGPFVAGRYLLTALHGLAFYKEAGRDTVRGHSGGLEVSRGLGFKSMILARAVGHALPGHPGTFSGALNLRTRWVDAFDTEAEGGQSLYATARALDAGVRERYGQAAAAYSTIDRWRVSARLRGAGISDDNERMTGQLRLSHPFARPIPQLRFLYQLAVDSTRRRSQNYYSPQGLVMNQLGVQYLGAPVEGATVELAYLPGYGVENGSPGRFVHRLDASLSASWQDKGFIRPFAALTKSPLYRSETVGFSFGLKF